MIAWVVAFLLTAAVLVLIQRLGLVRHARHVLAVAETSLATLGDPTQNDDAKESALRSHALRLFKLCGLLLVGGLAALVFPLAALRGADRLGVVTETQVMDVAQSWPFLLAVLGITLAVVATRPRRRGAAPAPAEFENRYSTVERWLHHLAFAGTPVQVALSRLEDRRLRARPEPVRSGPPVFITALPRAGTTLLLNLCARRDEFAAHTYRQMPFVLMPVVWERFSRVFRRHDAPRERAHGDGVLVSADSPEALEEILWLHFWPEHYEGATVQPWNADEAHPEFVEFFARHQHKLVALRADREGAGVEPPRRRYLSKNNANIARIDWLARACPEARFVIPFRSPLQHAASLLRQHRRFVEIHRADPFARHYMAGVGHFDFGANLRPIDFDAWTARASHASPEDLEYWLRYWTAAYRALASRADPRVHWVDFDALCTDPSAGLAGLADFLQLADTAAFVSAARDIHPPTQHEVNVTAVPERVLHDAHAVHARLQALAHPATSACERGKGGGTAGGRGRP